VRQRPRVVAGSSPFPRRCPSIATAKRSANSSNTPSCTRKRVGATQICPALRNLAPTASVAASSRSASSRTSTGACPPSSRVTRSTPSAASAPPILRAGMVIGEFHGVNAATGPTG
jgi:hypothetical protein